MAIVAVEGGQFRGEKIEIAGGRLKIGRSIECDLILPNKDVSSKHAQIILRQGIHWLQDLGSTNGTFVNRRRITHYRLEPGSEFVIGPYRLIFVESAEAFDREREKSLEDILKSLHADLIAKLNLKQLTIEQIRDTALRKRAGDLLDSLLKERRKDIPAGQNTAELKKSVLDAALGLGPLEDLLIDPSVTEIMVNAPDRIYVEKAGKLQLTQVTFLNRSAIHTAIERIVGPLGRRIDESSPMVDARLADGSRVNVIIPPLALDSPLVTIRKFPEKRMTIEDLMQRGALTEVMAEFLRLCVVSEKNIVISGGTGSGKTTLLNILASFIPDGERIVTIEDSAELQLPQEHVARLETRPPNIEGKGAVSIRDLVKNSLRMRPDRIVVGECRGGEALDMIQAMSTGHDGSMTTLHANSPDDALRRLETMMMMAGMDLPLKAIRDNIFAAVHIVVQASRFSDGTRKISSIAEISAMYDGNIQLQEIFTFHRSGLRQDGSVEGKHVPTGVIPTFVDELRDAGVGVDMSLFVPRE